MDYLSKLENNSIYILREAYYHCRSLAMLWSLGKDSNVMLRLAQKAFFGHVPFPVVHVDTGKKFRQMYEFRSRYAKEWGLDLVIGQCPSLSQTDKSLPPAARSASRKTIGLKDIIEKHGFSGVIVGIRRDEQSTRAKERVFSPRDDKGVWDIRNQPTEFWDHFNTYLPQGIHMRIHPLLSWSEIDIWRYIEREKIPVVSLYFAKNGLRYRSLGDEDITEPVSSNARDVSEIISELSTTKIAERSGRVMDFEREDVFECLRKEGYM